VPQARAVKVRAFGDASSPNVIGFCEGIAAAGAAIRLHSFEQGHLLGQPAAHIPSIAWLGRARYHLARPWAGAAGGSSAEVTLGYFVTGYGTLARFAARGPLVLIAAGSDVLVTDPRSVAARVGRKNLRAADLVIARGEHVLEGCHRMGLSDRTPTLVQPRGVDLTTFTAAAEPAGPRRWITTRRLAPSYRHDLIIEALARPIATERGDTLTIVGTGPEEGRLRSLVHRDGLGARVHFAGALEPSELAAHLAEHHVYVSASPSDGVSASLLEAMAVGLTPVVPDIAANRAWVDDHRNGVLFEVGSTDALASAVDRVNADPSLGQRARELNPRIVAERASAAESSRRALDAMAEAAERARRG
jgi:glycosyltransferase involved in cell wall biosynthesis